MKDALTETPDHAAHTDRIVDAIDRLTKAVMALSLDVQASDLIARHASAMRPAQHDDSATDAFGLKPLRDMGDEDAPEGYALVKVYGEQSQPGAGGGGEAA